MGLLDKIKNVVHKVADVTGVSWLLKKTGIYDALKKVWKKIEQPIMKFLGSGLGKVIMIAASVFTMGTALVAGASAWGTAAAAAAANSAAPSMMANFMAAGSATLNSLSGGLVGTSAATQAANAAGAAAGTATQAANLAGSAAGPAVNSQNLLQTTAAPAASQAAQTGGVLANAAKAAAGGAPAINPTVSITAKPGLLSRAGSAAWDFAKSEAGQNVIGKALEGYGQAKQADYAAEHAEKVDKRFQKLWSNISGTGLDNRATYDVNVPKGLENKGTDVYQNLNTKGYDYKYPTDPQPA
jgi:hypothetical protein